MARQNIDEAWKTDPRRRALVKRLGSERLADGMRVEINWLVMDHKGKPIPFKKFKFVEDYQAWIDCGLAELKDDFVEIAGADCYAEFFAKQAENGLKGGRPKIADNPNKPTETQINPTETETKPENPSFSFSFSKNTKTNAQPDGFDEFWEGYPRKVGKTKAKKAFSREIKTASLAEILKSRDVYRREVTVSQAEKRFIKHPTTFLAEWRDWLDPGFEQSDPNEPGPGSICGFAPEIVPGVASV